MTDVPPTGDGAVPPRPAPPAFDDDALAAALEADIKSYTQPISVIPPGASTTPPAQPAPVPPAPPAPPSAPAPPAPPPAPAPAAGPVQSPTYESDYEPPDVPEYIVPPAPPAPDYQVPPAPEPAPYEPPAPPAFDEPAFEQPQYEQPQYEAPQYEAPQYEAPQYEAPQYEQPQFEQPQFEQPSFPPPVFDLPEEPQAAASGPSTLDSIERLEDELRRRTLDEAAAMADSLAPAPEEATDTAAVDTVWQPALDHPAPGHVFPNPYQPFTDPVTIPRQDLPAMPPEQQPEPEQPYAAEPEQQFEPEPEPPAAPADEWVSAPPPAFAAPPPLVEPLGPDPRAPEMTAAEPEPAPAAPADGANAGYVAPTVLPPVREVKLEDVQGLPPPIGQQAAPLPPYDPSAAAAPPAFGAPPVPPPPSAPPFMPAPDAPDPFAAFGAPAPVSPDAFSGAYATPVDAAALGATEPPSLDENDDAVDDVDRIYGATSGEGAAAAAGAFPSEPISTQRVTETQPGLVDQKPENHPVFVVESAGVEPTALDLRAGRAARLFWLWFATSSSVVSIAIGAVLLSMGMSLRQAIVATLAGIALSFLPLGLGTLAGKWSGQPTMVVSRAAFGHVGNILPALIAVLTRVFWGAVLLWVLAISTARLLVFAGLDAGLGETVWTFVVLAIGFVIAGVVALFGYGFVARLQLILSILSGVLVAGLIYLTAPRLDLDAALGVPDGSWALVIGGAVIVFSFVGLAWVQSSSDIARYQRTASSGAQSMLWATVGATLPPFALIVWGSLLAASDPVLATGLASSPLPTIARLLPLWYPAPLLLATGLGLLSSVVLAIYSSGFAFQAVGVKARRSVTTVISAVLVAALAAGLVVASADALAIARDLATTLAVPVAAWAGIFAAEMMIRTRSFDSPSLLAPGGVYPQVRVANLLGFVLLTGVGFGLTTATFPGLTWQGFLFPLLGVGLDSPLATGDIGVLVALLLGIVVPLATAIPAIRRQERDSLKAEHTGPIPRITGAIPRQTGSIPRPAGAPTSPAPGPVPGGLSPDLLNAPPPRLEP